MTDSLRQQADLEKVVAMSLRVALPPQVAEYFVSCLSERHLPSQSVLSQFSLVLDTKLMVHARSWYAGLLPETAAPPVVHMMMGSSPVGHVDWVNS
eukprot:2170839-Alexandrium_andersonii.AAC.1